MCDGGYHSFAIAETLSIYQLALYADSVVVRLYNVVSPRVYDDRF